MNIGYRHSDHAIVLFEFERREAGLPVVVADEWPTDQIDIPQPLTRRLYGLTDEAVFFLDDPRSLIKTWHTNGMLSVQAAAVTVDDARAAIISLRELWPPQDRRGEGLSPVYFWSRGPDGAPRSVRRELTVPSWPSIDANYPPEVRARLEYLMSDYAANAEGGKLILWTGKPGTGKTFALRALARAWGEWCDVHYIVDPDVFFTGGIDYFFQVALNDSWQTTESRWRLIVCEDTGELLSADAKDRSGPALARFLNVCDGIIGQGLRIQILITTNEEIKSFHPAVARPGRAASQIEFRHFTKEEAREWLERDDLDRSYYTLAELYAHARGEDVVTLDRSSAGFAPSRVPEAVN